MEDKLSFDVMGEVGGFAIVTPFPAGECFIAGAGWLPSEPTFGAPPIALISSRSNIEFCASIVAKGAFATSYSFCTWTTLGKDILSILITSRVDDRASGSDVLRSCYFALTCVPTG